MNLKQAGMMLYPHIDHELSVVFILQSLILNLSSFTGSLTINSYYPHIFATWYCQTLNNLSGLKFQEKKNITRSIL